MMKFSNLKKIYKSYGLSLFFTGYANNRIYIIRKIDFPNNEFKKHPHFFVLDRKSIEDIHKTITDFNIKLININKK